MRADDQAHSKHVMTLSKMQKTIVIALLNNQMALKLKYEVSRKYHYTLNVLLQYILVCKSTFNNVGRHFLLKFSMYQGLSNFLCSNSKFHIPLSYLTGIFSGLEKSKKKRKNTFSHN